MFPNRIYSFLKHHIFRVIFWIFAGLSLILCLSLAVLITFNASTSLRHWGVAKLEAYIVNHYQLDFSIDDIYFSNLDHIRIEHLLLMDHQSDTLLMISSADIQVSLSSLFQQEINIESLYFRGITAKLKRPEGEALFNYEYLMPADTLEGKKKTQAVQEKRTPSDWNFRLQEISLLDTYFLFEDIAGGTSFSYRTDSTYISLSQFDLNSLTFIADKVSTDRSDIYLLSQLSTLEEEEKDTSAAPFPDILPRIIEANTLKLHYQDEQGAYVLNLSLDTAKLAFDTLDLNRQKLAISYVKLDKSVLEYEAWPVDSSALLPEDTTEGEQSESLWKIYADKVEVNHSQLVYHDNTQEDSLLQSLQDINLHLQDITYRMDERLKVEFLSFDAQLREPGAIHVSGKIDLSPQRSRIEQLSLALGKSHVQLNLQADLGWSNYSQWRQSADTLLLSIDDALIVVDELQAWLPQAYHNSGISSIRAQLNAQGTLSQLNIDPFWIKSSSGSRLDMKGSLAAKAQSPDFLIRLNELYLSANEMQLLLGSSFANTIKVHPINMQGQLQGKAGVYQAALQAFDQLNTLDVHLDITESHQRYQYHINVVAEDFGSQHWWVEERLPQSISLKASASGRTNLTHLNGDLTVNIDTLIYPKHSFQDITIESKYSERDLYLSVNSQDEWADMQLTAQFAYDTSDLEFQLEAQIKHLDLQPFLGLHDPLSLKTELSTEGHYNSLDDATITGRMHDFLLLRDTIKFAMQEISSRLTLGSNTVDYILKADSLLFQLQAEAPLSAITDSLQKAFDAPTLQLSDIEKPSTVAIPSFSIKARLNQTLSIHEKTMLGKGKLYTEWDYDTQQLQWVSEIDSLWYNEFQAYHLQTNISGYPRQVEFVGNIDSIQMYGMHFNHTKLSTQRNGPDFDISLSQHDEQDSLRFMLGTRLRLEDNKLHLSLDTSRLMYNYQTVYANKDNFITLGEDKLLGDVKLNWQGGGLSFLSTEDNPHARLNLVRLQLGMQSDSAWQAIVSGSVDVQYDITHAKGYFLFDSLLFNRKRASSLALHFSAAQDSAQQSYEVRLDRIGKNNIPTETDDSLLYLNAYKPDTTSWNGTARLHRLNLDTFQPLLEDVMDSVKGILDGEVRWQSTEDIFLLDGQIRAQNIMLKPSLMDNAFYLSDESIVFDHTDILFDTLTFHDVQQQKLSIDGKIALSDFRDPRLSLKLQSKNFTLFDIPNDALGSFSGKGLLTSDIGISGSLSRPEIKGSLNIDKGSSIRYVSEDEALEYQQQDDVLIFTREKATSATEEAAYAQDNELMDKLKLDLNIQIDPSTSALMILTERPRNDALVNGGGTFSLLKNPDEDFRLNGNYILNQGEIQIVSPFLISRKLTLKEGSRIIFNDDPYNPNIDITLMYHAYASASALFPADESTASSMDFEVEIDIKNKAKDPTLNFEVNVNDTDVQNALNTFSKEERERQALNLLFFNSFFVEGGEGSGFSARTEAEMMIANQLNRVANENIKGVEVNFAYENASSQSGSYSDDRDLSYELSKQLNDHLRLRLGGFISSGNSDNHSESLIGDIILEYYLDDKKKNYLKIFRQNSYESFFEGDVDVNGIGVVFEKNFRKLKHVLKGKRDE